MSERSTKQIRELLDSLYRVDSGGILATRIRCLGDFDLAEEAMHEAFAAALCQKAHRVCKICKPITLCFQFLGPAPYQNPRWNQQHPPPTNPAVFVAVPNAAGP